jgi:uncharacterized protein YuzE
MPNPKSWHIEPLLPGVPPGNIDAATVNLKFTPDSGDIYFTPNADVGLAYLDLQPSAVTEAYLVGIIPTLVHAGLGSSSPTTGVDVSIGAGGAAPGDLLTIMVVSNSPVSSVTDEGYGNFYSIDGQANTSDGKYITIASSVITNTIPVAGGVIIDFSSATPCSVDIWKWTGPAWVVPFPADLVSSNAGSSGASGAINNGSAGIPVAAGELCLMGIVSAGTITGGTGTMLEPGYTDGNALYVNAKYLINPGTSSPSISGISGSANPWASSMVTYRPRVPAAYPDSGTTPLKFTVSATEVSSLPTAYTDADTEYLELTPGLEVAITDEDILYFVIDIASDDCYAILTPHWVLNVDKRWQCVAMNRWSVAAVDDRWDTMVIAVITDNPCPPPPFGV